MIHASIEKPQLMTHQNQRAGFLTIPQKQSNRKKQIDKLLVRKACLENSLKRDIVF